MSIADPVIHSKKILDPDAELVLACQKGGPGAGRNFAKLMDRHTLRIHRRAARILGDENEAEDVTQEVFVNVHRFLHRYKPDQPFSHWLSIVTLNACRIELRRRASRNRRHEAFRDDPAKERFSAIQGDPILRTWLEEALGKLQPLTRECILLRALDGLPYRAIAERVGLSEPATKMRVLRGLRDLRFEFERRAKERNENRNEAGECEPAQIRNHLTIVDAA